MTKPLDADLKQEQSYFDHAFEVREAKRETRRLAYHAAGDNKARARLKANHDTDTTLGSPLDGVAFQRIDVASGAPCYVGRHAILDQQGDLLVAPWKAPFVMQLREATPDQPGLVVRRRDFRTEANSIVSFEDLIYADLAARISALDDPGLAVIQADAMLDDALTRDRSPEMQDIVQTIQAAQSRLVRAPHETLLVIQGGPGTGKTAVALHRVSWLLFNDRTLRPEDLLVIGPNPTFTRYINRVLPELGDEHVPQTDVVGMLGASVPVGRKDDATVAKLKGDERMVELISRGLSDRIRPPAEDSVFKVEGVAWRVELPPESVEELVRDLRSDHYASGRTKFREAAAAAIAVQVRRQFQADGLPLRRDPRDLLDTSEIDLFIERVWPQLSAQAFVRDLFGSLERLVSAAGSALTAEEVRLLRRPAAARLSEEKWSKEDLVLLDAANAEINGDPTTSKHIVVDEAQDLSPMQLLAIRRRSERGAMTIVGDIAQSTGHWSRDSWDDVVEALRSSMPVSIEALTHGYRVPRSVMDLAARLLPAAAPGVEAPIVVRDAEAPRIQGVPVEGDLFAVVAAIVQGHGAKGRFVGVICPDARRPALETALAAENVVWKDADRGGLGQSINLVSPVASKGLEFDAVVVVDPATIVDAGPEGHRMLYIALTRTTRFLDVLHTEGTLPSELMNMSDVADAPSEVTPMFAASRTEPPPSPGPTSLEGRTGDLSGGALRRPPASGRATVSVRGGTARERTVAFQAEAVIEQLEVTVPRALWEDVLRAALQMTEEALGGES
ncbi:AAA family ATPase [Actinotalea sp. K2]|uniref:HelD family protein n=1 Tax=Actinotalea sp. K2 TaxID=2939438 RepID=UPI002017BC7F|nr:AAA family ATPase [Actinotalea sp. K2]MCL3862941.1 AAA family ATPase [Actinotalea sp. K2]